jgi:hypothetical protein
MRNGTRNESRPAGKSGPPGKPSREKSDDPATQDKKEIGPELISLFRLLLKAPPKNHDVATCPICKAHGIRQI